jgi:hypothetical protein
MAGCLAFKLRSDLFGGSLGGEFGLPFFGFL